MDADPQTPVSYEEAKGVIGGIFGAAKAVVQAVKERFDYETLDNNPPETSPSNETSVVQLGIFEEGTVLLTADAGPVGLAEAAIYANSLGLLTAPTCIQVPHHGSRRNVTPSVLKLWLGMPLNNPNQTRGSAYCSVGKNKTEHPRKKVKNAFIRRGYPVHVTRTQIKTHFMGWGLRPGWVTSQPEPFSADVED